MKSTAEMGGAQEIAESCLNSSAAGDLGVRSKVVEFKREQIMDVAARLFYERGYRATTLEAIAATLEVTKPFIYYHFHNKEDILQHLFLRTMEITLAAVEGVDVDGVPPGEALWDLGKRYVSAVIEVRSGAAIFWRGGKDLPELDKRRARAFRQQLEVPFLKVIQRGCDSGEFSVEDVPLTLLCLEGMATWAYNWYRPDGRFTEDELAEHIADLMVSMVQGGKIIDRAPTLMFEGAASLS